jgi:hypothetical protein
MYTMFSIYCLLIHLSACICLYAYNALQNLIAFETRQGRGGGADLPESTSSAFPYMNLKYESNSLKGPKHEIFESGFFYTNQTCTGTG